MRTVRSRLTPLRADVSLGSCLLPDDIRNTDTELPSLLLLPWKCFQPTQAVWNGSPIVYGNVGVLLTRAESLANILDLRPVYEINDPDLARLRQGTGHRKLV